MKSISNAFYGNILVLSIDNEALFRCNEKRALWYVNRDLAKWLNDNTIQFNFVTKGEGHKNDPFYTSEKENVCVVCGSKHDLSKHHVVPKCYRKHFVDEYKSYASHDVLLLCIDCHNAYESIAEKYKKDMIKLYLDDDLISYYKHCDAKMYEIISSAKTLSKFNNIPDEKKQLILNKITTHLPIVVLDNGEIDKVAITTLSKIKMSNDDNFSKRIVESLDTEQKIFDFYVLWRKHFVDTMNPKYLPTGWNIHRPFLATY